MRVRFALAIAFSTACSCWARSRHERPASIISTMLRRWPSARRSRFTISGCVAWSVSYAIHISYPGGEDMSSVTPFTSASQVRALLCASAGASPRPWGTALPLSGAFPCDGRGKRQHGHLSNPHPCHMLDPEGAIGRGQRVADPGGAAQVFHDIAGNGLHVIVV